MAAIPNDNALIFGHFGPDIAMIRRRLRKRQQAIQNSQMSGGCLNFRQLFLDEIPNRAEQMILNVDDLFLCPKNLGFKFLQFGRDIPFRVDQGLLADIVGRYGRRIGVSHFDIITEHFIVADFQGFDASAFLFPCFQILNPLPAVARQAAQFIQLQIVAITDKAAFAHGKRRGIDNRRPDHFRAIDMSHHPQPDLRQCGRFQFPQNLFQFGKDFEGAPQGGQIPGIGAAYFNPRQNPLQIIYGFQAFAHDLADSRSAE